MSLSIVPAESHPRLINPQIETKTPELPPDQEPAIVTTIELPYKLPYYHSRDLMLASSSKPAHIKLTEEFERAQKHMHQQKPRFNSEELEQYATSVLDPWKKPLLDDIKLEQIELEGCSTIEVAYAQGRRREMEDAHIATMHTLHIDGAPFQYELFGVFDGHGGKNTANFVAAHIAEEIEKAIFKHGFSDEGIRNTLKEAFVQLDARTIQEIKDQSGSTAVITLKMGPNIWTANLGDSRAILKIGDQILQLSEDAKPLTSRFQQSIVKRGGIVYHGRVNGAISVARAFNDRKYLGSSNHYVISARPKITKVTLNPNSEQPVYLIQACDGIWDVLSSQEAGKLTDAKKIVTTAINLHSEDNCTALVARFKS
jgi:serine/threonine protein phosphatase PrpC